jgi:hypothetical protein
MLCFTPERTTRGWYVECHEPTDADSLPSLVQLHNVLNTSFKKFENGRICSDDCVKTKLEVKFTDFFFSNQVEYKNYIVNCTASTRHFWVPNINI